MSSWPLAGQKVLTKGYCGIQMRKGDLPAPVDIWIYSPLHVDAVTYDEQKDNFGRLLRFKTALKEWCEWAMLKEVLEGYGEELCGVLLAMGDWELLWILLW